MLWGTRNRPPDWCQPAPSHTTTACAPSAICVLISLRCSDIASALTLGMMIAAPTLRAWQMAPNRYAESWRLSRTMGGREPDRCPNVFQAAFLADPCFVLEPDLNRLACG